MNQLKQRRNFIEPHFLPLGQIVSHNAIRCPDVVAMTIAGRETTWSEFDAYSNRVANGLLGAGIRPGARVAYLGKTTDEAFQILHGVAKVRCVFTPINWRLAAPEVAYVLEDAQAEWLFVSSEFLPLVAGMLADSSTLKRFIVLDDPPAEDGFQSWRDSFEPLAPNIELLASDVVLQLYTSGTTGRPKGALITQEYVINVGKTWHAEEEDAYDMYPGEEHLNFLPIFHTSGSISGQYMTFARGCGIVILPDFDPDQILEYLDQRSIPVLGAVPTMLQMFLAHPKFSQTDFSDVRYVQYGAAPMPLVLRDSLVEHVGCRFCQGYGATESLNITVLRPSDHERDGEHLLSVGRPMSGVKIKIVDSEQHELPVGDVGEIAIQTPSMTLGYWNLPDATKAAFSNGWYLTGDGGCLDEQGYLYLKERIKDLIISGGENVYPSEIENLLYTHPMVESVAVVAAPDEKWGEVPTAFIVVNEGYDYNPEALREFVADKLARYKQPKYYELLQALPLNAAGKVLKKDLRELAKTKIE